MRDGEPEYRTQERATGCWDTILIDSKLSSGNICYPVRFEVFTAVVMKSIIFWDMTPCSPLSFKVRFGGIYGPHLQGRRNRFSKTSKQSRARWRRYVPPKCRLKLNGLHGVISQKMIPFICYHAVQNLSSFRLLSENLKIEIIFFFLYGAAAHIGPWPPLYEVP
jgi:hypothetical protein